MVEVVVFGKPRSFESYEFDFGVHRVQEVENTHHEPIVKPVGYGDIVFHYYQKEGIAGWEVYRRCHGYDSDRPGIVFGVGIKSDKDFGLIDTMGNLIMPLWEDFAQAFLDKNFKFQFESIVNALKTTKWSLEEEEKVRNNVGRDSVILSNQEKPLLLLSVENPGEIKAVEGLIKEYNDVYIASNPEIFQNLINKDVLAKQANNEIYIVKDGKIESLQKPDAEKSADDKNGSKGWITWIWGGKGSNSSDSETKGTGGGRKNPNRIPKLVTAAAVIAFIAAIVLLFVFKPKPADRIELAKAPESGFITDGFDLQPKLFHGKSEKTSTKREEIKWSIEGDGSKYIDFDDAHYLLKINDRFRTDKPREESTIIVIAMHNEKELAKAQYTLGKYELPKANKATMSACSQAITTSWKTNPQLYYYDGKLDDSDVSTQLSEVKFDVQPSGFASIDKDYKLIVKKRPDNNDTNVTVTITLDNQIIGCQDYTIAKKDEVNNDVVQPQGTIYYKFGSNDWSPLMSATTISTKNLPTAKFEARNKDGKQLTGGKWHFSDRIFCGSVQNNPIIIDEIRNTGTANLSYKKDGKTMAIATFNVQKQDK